MSNRRTRSRRSDIEDQMIFNDNPHQNGNESRSAHNSKRSEHRSHKHSSHFSSERRFKSVYSATKKERSSSSHHSSSSRRSSSASKNRYESLDPRHKISNGEKRLSLSEFAQFKTKRDKSYDRFSPKSDKSDKSDKVTRSRTRKRDKIEQITSKEVDEQPKIKIPIAKYDFEVFFAARFAASARSLDINSYYESLIPMSNQDDKERSAIGSQIVQKIISLIGSRSQKDEWRFLRDAIINNCVDELFQLAKRYVEVSDLQLTRFFAADQTDVQNVPPQYVDALTLSGISEQRIGDRTHIFTVRLLKISTTSMFQRIKAMSTATGRMGDIFGECVFNYVMTWLILFPNDFNYDFYKSVSDALKSAISVTTQSKYLIYFAQSIARSFAKKQIRLDRFNMLPTMKQLSHHQWGVPPLGVPPQAIAEHFMFVESETIANLSIDDIIGQRLLHIVTGFNNTCEYICRHILADNQRSRARNISYWIDTMESATRVGNIFLLFEISAALNNPSILRLHRAWELVSAEMKDRFYSLDELTSPFDSYKSMREFLKKKQKTDFLPFVLAFARMGEQARALPVIGGINLLKMEIVGSLALQMREWGIKTYSLDQNVVEFIKNIKTRKYNTNDIEIDVLSKRLEPPIILN